jgi:hypothetical protein
VSTQPEGVPAHGGDATAVPTPNVPIFDNVDDSHTGLTPAQTQSVQDSFTNPQLGVPHGAAASERLLDRLADPADPGNVAAMAAINAYTRDRLHHGQAVSAAVARIILGGESDAPGPPPAPPTPAQDAMADIAGYVALGMSGDAAAAADVEAMRERMRQYMTRNDPVEFARQYYSSAFPSMNAYTREALVTSVTAARAQRSMADRLAAMTPRQRQMFLFGLPYGRRADAELVDSEVPAVRAAADVPQRADTQERSIAVNHSRRTPRRRPQPAADTTPAAPQPPVVHIRQRPRRPGQVPQPILTPDEPETSVPAEAVPQVPADWQPADWQPPRALLPALLEQLWAVAASFDTGAAALGITFNPVGDYQVFGLWCTDAVNRWLGAPSHSDYTYGVESVRQAFRNSEPGGPEIHERCAPVAHLLAMYPLLRAGRPEGDRTRDYLLYASAAVVARILIVETQAVLVVAPNPGGIPHRRVDWDAADAEAASSSNASIVASWSTDVDAVHGVSCPMAAHWAHRSAGLEPDVEARIMRHIQAVPRVTRPYIIPGTDNQLAPLLVEIPAQAAARGSPPYRLFCGSDGHPIACGRLGLPAPDGQATPPVAYQPSATVLASLAEELRISHSSVRRRAWSAFQTLGLGAATVTAHEAAVPVPPQTARTARGRATSRAHVPLWLDFLAGQCASPGGAFAAWWSPTGSWHCGWVPAGAVIQRFLNGTYAADDLRAVLRVLCNIDAHTPGRLVQGVHHALTDCLNALGRHPLLGLATAANAGHTIGGVDFQLYRRERHVARVVICGNAAVLLCGMATNAADNQPLDWDGYAQQQAAIGSDRDPLWCSAAWNHNARIPHFPSAATARHGWSVQVQALEQAGVLIAHMQAQPAGTDTARPVPNTTPQLTELPAVYWSSVARDAHRLLAAPDGTPVFAIRPSGGSLCSLSPRQSVEVAEALRVHRYQIEHAATAASGTIRADSRSRSPDADFAAHADIPTYVGMADQTAADVPLPNDLNARRSVPVLLDFLGGFAARGRAVAAWWGLTGEWRTAILPETPPLSNVLANAFDGADLRALLTQLRTLPSYTIDNLPGPFATPIDRCLTALGCHPLLSMAMATYYDDHAQAPRAAESHNGVDIDCYPLYRSGSYVATVVRCGCNTVLLCATTTEPLPLEREIAWESYDNSADWQAETYGVTEWVPTNGTISWPAPEAAAQDIHWQVGRSVPHALQAYLAEVPTPVDQYSRSVRDMTPRLYELPARYRNERRLPEQRLFVSTDGTPVCTASIEPTPVIRHPSAFHMARAAEQLRTAWLTRPGAQAAPSAARSDPPPAPSGVAAAFAAAAAAIEGASLPTAEAAMTRLEAMLAPNVEPAVSRAALRAAGWDLMDPAPSPPPVSTPPTEANEIHRMWRVAASDVPNWVAPARAVPLSEGIVARYDHPFAGVVQNSRGAPLLNNGQVATSHGHIYQPASDAPTWVAPTGVQRIDDAAEIARQITAPIPTQIPMAQLGNAFSASTGGFDPVPVTRFGGMLADYPLYAVHAPSAVTRPQIPDAPVVDDNNYAGMPLLFTVAARAALPRLFDSVWASAVRNGDAHAVLWYGPTGQYGLKYFPESANLRWVTHNDRERHEARQNLYADDVGSWVTAAQRAELEQCLNALAAYPLWSMAARGSVRDRCVLVRDDYAVRLVPSSDDFAHGYLIIIGPAELAAPPPPIDWERAQDRWGRHGFTANWNQTPAAPSEFDVPRPDLLHLRHVRSCRTSNIVDLALYLCDHPNAPMRRVHSNSLFTGNPSGMLHELPASVINRDDPALRWRLFSSRSGLPLFAARIVNGRPVVDDLSAVAARHLGEMLRVTNPNVHRHLGEPAVTQTGQLL